MYSTHHVAPIKPRAFIKELSQDEVTKIFGDLYFQNIMTSFGWISFQATTVLDNRKVDFICRYQHALIEVQIKCRNYHSQSDNWSWNNIYENEEKIFQEIL